MLGRTTRLAFAAIAGLCMLFGVACAPRFKEQAIQVGASPSPGAVLQTSVPGKAGTAGRTGTSTTGGTTGTAPGQATVQRGGVVKIGGLFPLSGGLSRLGIPSY